VFDDRELSGRRDQAIAIHGAREHNLKNVSLTVPRGRFVVVTGVSGSGKSTLAFDLLFAEGQRRFLDSMNVYARQFVEQLSRPDMDLITGIPPRSTGRLQTDLRLGTRAAWAYGVVPSRSFATTGQWSLGNWPSREKVTISMRSAATSPRLRIQSMRGPSF
jgi:ABC-type molybdenum transport system ATPase subunit/photorepair protein PhrA